MKWRDALNKPLLKPCQVYGFSQSETFDSPATLLGPVTLRPALANGLPFRGLKIPFDEEHMRPNRASTLSAMYRFKKFPCQELYVLHFCYTYKHRHKYIFAFQKKGLQNAFHHFQNKARRFSASPLFIIIRTTVFTRQAVQYCKIPSELQIPVRTRCRRMPRFPAIIAAIWIAFCSSPHTPATARCRS